MSLDRTPAWDLGARAFPLSSKRASIVVLGTSLVLLPLVAYLLDQPWTAAEPEGGGAPHFALLASTWVFAVPFPYWGYRRSRLSGQLATFLALAFAVTISFVVSRHIFFMTKPLLTDFYPYRSPNAVGIQMTTVLTSLAVLTSKAYRSLVAPRVESLGALIACVGVTLAILWCVCAGLQSSTGWRSVLVAAGLVIAGGQVHLAYRLRWLRRVVEGKVVGVRAVPLATRLLAEAHDELPTLHEPVAFSREAQRFTLVRVGGDAPSSFDDRGSAIFYLPQRFDWLLIGLRTTLGTVAISGVVVAGFVIVVLFMP